MSIRARNTFNGIIEIVKIIVDKIFRVLEIIGVVRVGEAVRSLGLLDLQVFGITDVV